MPTDTLHIAIDTPQPRVTGDRLAKYCTGRGWDMPNSSPNAFVEFVAFTGMLTPLPYTAEWLTTFTGNYARLRKSELSIAGSSSWTEYQRSGSSGYYVHSRDNNVKVYTNQSWERNRPMWLSWIVYNVGNEAYETMRCGWNENGDADIQLAFWSDGSVEIWKNGDRVGNAKINERGFYLSELGPQRFENGYPGKMLANETVDVALIPGRRRDMLVLSNMGGGFVFRFEDIDPADPAPTITGAGPFWFQVPVGQATVQIAPLKFKTSGYLLSPAYTLQQAPATGETPENLLTYDGAGYGTQSAEVSLVETDGSTDFVADGTLADCRIRVDLTGDGNSTPFVYSATSAFPALTGESLDEEVNLDDFWMSARLDVPEDPEGVQMEVMLTNAPGAEEAGATDLTTQGNRDIEVKVGELSFFIGRTLDPEWEEGPGPVTQELMLECRDRILTQQNYRIQDPEPVDTLNFSDAIAYFAKLPGYSDSHMDIGAIDYKLPSVEGNSDGEYALLPEVGDPAVQWIRRLWEEFAQKCYWGWVPTADGVKFRFKTPAQLGSESQITLYHSDADAQADGRSAGDYKRWVYFSKPKFLIPEANDIRVVGRDPRTQLPIIRHYRDRASADPTLPRVNRPDNWVGELRQFSYVDPSLTTEGDVFYALGNFIEVLPVRREIREVRCQFLTNPETGVPLWRGDCFTIYGKGKYRIRTLSGLFDLEYAHPSDSAQDRIWRETTYVVQKEPE